MPIHDWARVDANLYHHFHQFWTTEICRALNGGLLPVGFEALIEQHAAGREPDVLAVERPRRPAAPQGGALLADRPRTRHVIEVKQDRLAARGNRIVVRHQLGDVVCVIEVVSPGNKHSQFAIQSFVGKAVEFLRNGVHLLVVDLFPPTPRDPRGLPGVILDELGEPFELAADKPLTLAGYATGDPQVGPAIMAYVEQVAVGDPLPNMPAYLEWEGYVSVPLEATYQAAWANCPPSMREVVETGRLVDE
jgi:hypothetical protein